MEDTTILGRVIPKGTTVVFPTVTGYEDETTPIYGPDVGSDVAKRNESLKDRREPEASRKVGYWAAGTGHLFQPERWLDADGQFDINAGPSLPFSLGQRACFGKNLAVRVHERTKSRC
jgi:cytochrome P450